MKNTLKERTDLLRQQIHSLIDEFYDETTWTPEINIETKEVIMNKKEAVLASYITIMLK